MRYIVAQDGTGDFRTIQEAVDALPADSRGEVREIRVKPGTYHERVIVNRENTRLIGEDTEKTILTWSSYAMEIHPDGTERTTFRSWTLMVNAEDVTVENLTIRNDAGDGSGRPAGNGGAGSPCAGRTPVPEQAVF